MGRGEISSGRHSKRHPLDWYVDPIWCARQLAAALGGFAEEKRQGLAIWDPSCGMGNTLQAAWELGLEVIGSDLVDNFDWATFDACPELKRPVWFRADFLERKHSPGPCSVVFNPPYSYQKDIAERFARHALTLSDKHVCMLMPNKWLVSQARYRLFTEHPPLAILYLCQRPSMPPGDLIGAMGNRAFSGGMIDYCWIVWDVTRPTARGETRSIWLPPLAQNCEIQPLINPEKETCGA
ncbi:MAG: hypothetical protein AAFZ11_00800 [Pseudomonadota bacterium]